MLTTVEARTIQGSFLSMSLQNASSGFIIQDIDGLDPVKATLVSSSFAGLDGVQYQSSRREVRNIVLQVGLEPDYILTSVEDLRKRLYQFFMPKTLVFLRFYMSTGLIVDITGRVESFETPLFTKEPAVSISITCFNPDFYESTAETINGSTTTSIAETLVPYEGSVETGIVFTLSVNRSVSDITFYHIAPDNSLQSLAFSAPLIAGDILTISTISGDKRATLTRGTTVSSVVYAISPQSKWIEFMPGDNKIRVYTTGAAIPYTIVYTNKYGGL